MNATGSSAAASATAATTDVTDGARPLLPVADGRRTRGYLRAALRRRRALLVATTAVMIAQSAIGLVGPIAIGWVTQAIVDGRGTSAVIGPVVLLAAAAVLGAPATWASNVLLARVVLPEVAGLREDVVATALALPVDRVEETGSGDLVSRVSGDVERVTEAAQGGFGSFVSAALAILATLVGLASLDWRFALAGLLAVPIQVFSLRWYLRTSRPIYAAGRTAEGHRTSTLLGAFAALPTVRSLRVGGRQYARVEDASLAAAEYEFTAIRNATRFFGRLNVAEFVGLGAILLAASVLVRSGSASVGAATTAALFFAGLFDPINAVLGSFDSVQQAAAGLARLVGVLDAAPARPAGAPAQPAGVPAQPAGVPAQAAKSTTAPVRSAGAGGSSADGGPSRPAPPPSRRLPVLALHAADFGYGDRADVVHGVTLRIEPGRHVALVGTTGSGKSTVATLLAGLRTPRRGTATLDGTPLAGLSPTELHRRVALVTQETHLFAGTVADNIRMGRPEASDAEVALALEAVGATGWVDALPDGAATVIGAGGHHLGPSQAQHLALARLFLLDPEVVVLDEATAEGGSDSARLLDTAAARVLRGRSALLVAHRLSQTATADTILVMEEGRVTEQGSHEELRAAGGTYAALWDAWSRPS
ncbi:putative ABC transporter ATP-binding protein [Actinacidiphila reveromycinica]|uniref:Putative ABC transporter ATP-binding protein n=1 Tax=Actinacidiphila reveromycinica TaxID=659352 RepID=A0A7U3UQM9_9ACTN|nr:ABC transporter ATP-binding protein [Streptomyces sp. SN-593]BBA96971.1 putative ABC transporter ATP-binding protein [Streptomyces sp. SN-593]